MMANFNYTSMNAEKFSKVLKDIDTFIFDADGVLWLGENVMAGSPKFLDYLIQLGKQVIILTNNATKSRAVYAKKLASMGYHSSITKDSIVNPAAVVADTLYRAGINKNGKKVYLIGSQGVQEELDNLGITYFGTGHDPVSNQSDNRPFIYDLELDEDVDDVGAVVVGYDKHFNYHKLMKAANYINQNENCIFVATNTDETCPGPNPDTVIPDAGPLVTAVQVACGREPIIVGKPHTAAFEYIRRRWTIDPAKTMMIGDRTNTDIKFGRDHGLRTMLVLSGCHGVAEIEENHAKSQCDMIPEFYADCLGALVPFGY
uniref:4-nitrophenylphosphatase n=1 Tax=Panagrellus redivivus TaxID=6233 RepID=A0A7E5A179_PANRE